MKIKPALTEQEWAKGVIVRAHPRFPEGPPATIWDEGTGQVLFKEADHLAVHVFPHLRHPVAALCLKDQPFGFTRKDVQAVQLAARKARQRRGVEGSGYADYLDKLADRIEALLPPEGG